LLNSYCVIAVVFKVEIQISANNKRYTNLNIFKSLNSTSRINKKIV